MFFKNYTVPQRSYTLLRTAPRCAVSRYPGPQAQEYRREKGRYRIVNRLNVAYVSERTGWQAYIVPPRANLKLASRGLCVAIPLSACDSLGKCSHFN